MRRYSWPPGRTWRRALQTPWASLRNGVLLGFHWLKSPATKTSRASAPSNRISMVFGCVVLASGSVSFLGLVVVVVFIRVVEVPWRAGSGILFSSRPDAPGAGRRFQPGVLSSFATAS